MTVIAEPPMTIIPNPHIKPSFLIGVSLYVERTRWDNQPPENPIPDFRGRLPKNFMEGCNSAATQTTTVCNFNPRFPYGKRRSFISRGVLSLPFQSTLPRGERRRVNAQVIGDGGFQSTLPRGERRRSRKCPTWKNYFNPHSHMGSDNLARCI